jgi:general secretion pathway protein K
MEASRKMFFFEKRQRPPCGNQKTFASEQGFALLLVLWTMALLALLGAQVTGAGRAETKLATALREGAQLQAAADGAIYETIWHMLQGGGDVWEPGAMTRVLDEPGGRVVVTVTDERGKLDVNQVPPGLLQALFSVLGADRDTAQKVANAVADWRAQQPSGNAADSPSAASYRTAGLAWGPNGAEFQRLDELQLVQGMTPALYQASVPYLTMALEQGPWLNLAGPVVLAALAKAKRDTGITMENADPRGPVVLRLTAQATGRNGAAFTRRVLFRLDGTLSGPAWKYRILAWEDGPAA